MKTTIVQSSELGDDWTPSAHMPRALCMAKLVQQGDRIRIRVRQPASAKPGTPRRWYLATVTDVDMSLGECTLMTDSWPIPYVCSKEELVEVVEMKRKVKLHCMDCQNKNVTGTTELTVTLDDFLDIDLLRRGELRAMIINPDIEDVYGYCPDHAREFLN